MSDLPNNVVNMFTKRTTDAERESFYNPWIHYAKDLCSLHNSIGDIFTLDQYRRWTHSDSLSDSGAYQLRFERAKVISKNKKVHVLADQGIALVGKILRELENKTKVI